MTKARVSTIAVLVLAAGFATTAYGQSAGGPETVVVRNGPITLHALLWRPLGRGPFPAILLNHGSDWHILTTRSRPTPAGRLRRQARRCILEACRIHPCKYSTRPSLSR